MRHPKGGTTVGSVKYRPAPAARKTVAEGCH